MASLTDKTRLQRMIRKLRLLMQRLERFEQTSEKKFASIKKELLDLECFIKGFSFVESKQAVETSNKEKANTLLEKVEEKKPSNIVSFRHVD
jgi:uncharacterized coiled-coil protein SlyX